MRFSDRGDEPMLHVVLFSLLEPVDPVRIARVRTLVQRLATAVDGASLVACGPNASPSSYATSWQECAITRFENASVRDAYLKHPLHEELSREASGGFASDVVVCDVIEHGHAYCTAPGSHE